MSNTLDTVQKILTERLELVGELSRLNAEQLLNTQKLSGNQMDLMRCTDQLDDHAGTSQLHEELARAKALDQSLRQAITDCDDKIQALEEKVALLDQQLEII